MLIEVSRLFHFQVEEDVTHFDLFILILLLFFLFFNVLSFQLFGVEFEAFARLGYGLLVTLFGVLIILLFVLAFVKVISFRRIFWLCIFNVFIILLITCLC